MSASPESHTPEPHTPEPHTHTPEPHTPEPHTPEPHTQVLAGQPGGGWLYSGLLLMLAVGILLPVVTNAIKPEDSPLHAWSWHPRAAYHHTERYARYAILNMVLLVAALGWRGRVQDGLARVAAWVRQPDHRGPRAIIFAFSCLALTSFLTHLHVGFWFYGIPGWTYESSKAPITPLDPDAPPPPSDEAANYPFLRLALRPEAAKYLPTVPALVESSGVMFLHFQDGQVLPANRELTGFVFPNYVFGPNLWPGPDPHGNPPSVRRLLSVRDPRWAQALSNHDELLACVKRGLTQRRAGRRLLLPDAVAYPPHAFFMFIDYRDYPPASALHAVSFWYVQVHVDAERALHVTDAKLWALAESTR